MPADYLLESLLFAASGLLALLYYRAVPPQGSLRRRLPNRVTPGALLLALAIATAIWGILTRSSGFSRFALATTLVVYLLLFETLLLLLLRWLETTFLALLLALVAAAMPFLALLLAPSFTTSNLILVAATFGAPTLLVRMGIFRPWLVILLVLALTVNDVLNVLFVYPNLPLGPLTEPLPVLIFPTVVIGEAVVGFGDFMFLALGTTVLFGRFGIRAAVVFTALEAAALLATGLLIAGRDVLVPFLLVMAPIFLLTYGACSRRARRRTANRAPRTTA